MSRKLSARFCGVIGAVAPVRAQTGAEQGAKGQSANGKQTEKRKGGVRQMSVFTLGSSKQTARSARPISALARGQTLRHFLLTLTLTLSLVATAVHADGRDPHLDDAVRGLAQCGHDGSRDVIDAEAFFNRIANDKKLKRSLGTLTPQEIATMRFWV